MRHLISTSLVACAILVTVTGCGEYRNNMRAAPNRGGHAWVDETKKPGLSNTPTPDTGEMFYSCVAGDTLSNVAKKFGMTTEEVIKRNELKDLVLKPKQLLVVKDTSAPAAK